MLLTPPNQPLLQSDMEETLNLLERCSSMKELKQIQAQVLKRGSYVPQIIVSKLLASCASSEFGNLSYARMVFDGIRSPNIIMWNTMIRAYSNSNFPEASLLFYQQMLHHPVTYNAHTFPLLLKACSTLSAFEETKQIHAHIIKSGFGSEVYASNSLLHVYANSGSIEHACCLFDRLPQPDIVSWNTMINGYIKFGSIDMASEIFQAMPAKNVISWTIMISGLVKVGLNKKALSLFHEMMVAGIEPDSVTLCCSLSACAGLGALDQGRSIHAHIHKNGIKQDPILGCVLVDVYAKCGEMETAKEVFRRLEKKCVCAWTALIGGFAVHGKGREALEWFIQMQKTGTRPTSITFTAILTACSHGRLIEEGKSLFESISSVHKMKPTIEHYGCMVDLLGRAGLLKEAKGFIDSMPIKPNAAVWGALLNACNMHRNVELGKEIGKMLIEVDPDHEGRYIHLASIHSAAGEWDQAVRVRRKIKERGLLSHPGCSAISLNGVVHEFFAGGGSCHIKEIYDMWNTIANRNLELGGF